MDFGKPGYTAQVATYLKNQEYGKAYDLGKTFVQAFPDDVVAHFLLAESAFWSGKYEEAAFEGSKAFNKSSNDEDMLACAIITSSAYYELGKYAEGYKLLKMVEPRKKSEELEKLLFIFSLEMNDDKEAMKHVDDLFKLNKKAAEELIVKYLKS